MNENTISFDELFMRMAYLVATKSKDPSSKMGAVLVKNNRVISTGFNGFPEGVDDLEDRYKDRDLKYKFVVHAEDNAILSAARFGMSTLHSVLYVPSLPCHDCMKSIIQSGISEVVIHSQWPTLPNWKEQFKITEILKKESGVIIRHFDKKLEINTIISGQVVSV